MEFKNLKEITTKIASGSTPRGGKNSYTDSGPIALIRSQNIYNNNFTRNGLVYINNEQAKKLSNVEINKDDILINITGDSVARVTMVDSTVLPARINQHVMILRPEESMVNKYYLLAYLSSNIAQESLKHLASDGATRAALTKRNLETFKIPNLSFKNQEYIGNLLKYINKKIEVNKNIIANLEELSQTLFKRWFVDFKFPDENGNPYKSSGGKMVNSELGEIPENWGVSNLDNIASFVSRGITPKYNKNSDLQIPILNQKVNKGPRLDLQYIKYFDGHNRIKKELYAQKYDLLLNSLGQGTLGRIHLFTRKSGLYLIDQHISIIRFDNTNYSYFYYAHINTDLIQGQIESLISGSTGMLMLNITKIRNLKVILPTEELVLKYSWIVSEYFKKITQLIYENENLIELRDTLLPKLMSGELEIPDDIEVNEDELSI